MSAANKESSAPNAATQAAEWFINLQGTSVSRQEQQDFVDWLRCSPVHVEEFLRLTALQGDLAGLPEIRNVDIDRLLAKLHTGDGNVVRLQSPAREQPATSKLTATSGKTAASAKLRAAIHGGPRRFLYFSDLERF